MELETIQWHQDRLESAKESLNHAIQFLEIQKIEQRICCEGTGKGNIREAIDSIKNVTNRLLAVTQLLITDCKEYK